MSQERKKPLSKVAEEQGKLDFSFLQKSGAPGSRSRKRGRKRSS